MNKWFTHKGKIGGNITSKYKRLIDSYKNEPPKKNLLLSIIILVSNNRDPEKVGYVMIPI